MKIFNHCGGVLIFVLINTSASSHWLKVSCDQLALSINLGIFGTAQCAVITEILVVFTLGC